MLKAVKFADRAIDKIVSIILILFLLIGGYVIYDNIYVFNGADQNDVIVFKPDNAEKAEEVLKELSKDCVGWVTLDDSKIDYPIMQGDNNTDYLNINPYGEYSLSGAIFLDFRNSADFSDQYSLLYGHHMSGEYMFGALDKWLDRDYFDSHRTGQLITTSGKTYKITLFAIGNTSGFNDTIFNPQDNYPLDFIKSHSSIYYNPISNNGKILVLSTCTDAASSDRTILCGILTES